MTERSRKRISKWDVISEPPVPTKQADAPHDSGIDNVTNSDWNSSNYDGNTSSVPSEMKADPAMISNGSPLREDDNITLHRARSPSPYFSKLPDMGDGDRDIIKDSYSETLSRNLTREKDDDFSWLRKRRDKSFEQQYDKALYPGRDEWRKRSPAISPKRSWSRSQSMSSRSQSRSRSRGRSRSRSRSRDRSRSRSPSYGYRRGPQRSRSRTPPYSSRREPEKLLDRDRMGSELGVPCRDFALGRCRRGNECRFIHDDSARRQPSRYHENATSDTRDHRSERGRYSREQTDYSHDRFCRNDGRITVCFDFIKGRCQRGSECRYAHHEASYDSGRDMRDEHRVRNEPQRRIVRDTPCKFFAEGCCRRGEACSFSHQLAGPHDDSRNTSRNDPYNQGDAGMDDSQSNAPESNVYQNQPQNQFIASQPMQTQNFTPNIQIQQSVPPMLLNGPMQQPVFALPQSVPGQFIAPTQAPPNFNIPMQNIPVLPITPNQQNYIQQNFNLPAQIPQNLSLPPLDVQSQLNFNIGQNQNMALQPPNLDSLIQSAGTLETQPSQLNSDTPITPKVVTSEQAAKITNISASLAQFFGTAAALNPQIATGSVPFVKPNQDSFTQQQANLTSGNIEPVNSNTSNIFPLFDKQDSTIKEANINTDSSVANKFVELEVNVQQRVENDVPSEVNGTEKVDNKKEQGEDGEKSKDAKGMRLFKCALVDFVKDALKPNWKEGQLSREAHKTIVKKVVEKVTGAMQSQNIPQTQEKIDIYLSHSRAKLTKLVQAYVEKYVKA